jgi:hypothetical protein
MTMSSSAATVSSYQVASLSRQLADAKANSASLQNELSVVSAHRDDLRAQLSESRKELQTSAERATVAVHAKGALEAKIAGLEARLSSANHELSLLLPLKERVDGIEARMAAVDAADGALERDEERDMGVKRVQRTSGVDGGALAGQEEGGGEAQVTFPYDVTFAFDERMTHGAGEGGVHSLPSALASNPACHVRL